MGLQAWALDGEYGRFVSERMPLALDTGVVGVEGLADADDVQAGLVGQLGGQLHDLLTCLAGDELLPHRPVHCSRAMGSGQAGIPPPSCCSPVPQQLPRPCLRRAEVAQSRGRAGSPRCPPQTPSTHSTRPAAPGPGPGPCGGSRRERHRGAAGRSPVPPPPRTAWGPDGTLSRAGAGSNRHSHRLGSPSARAGPTEGSQRRIRSDAPGAAFHLLPCLAGGWGSHPAAV